MPYNKLICLWTNFEFLGTKKERDRKCPVCSVSGIKRIEALMESLNLASLQCEMYSKILPSWASVNDDW